MIWPRFYILNATLFQESFNSSFELGFSVTLGSRLWTKCSYGKEVYISQDIMAKTCFKLYLITKIKPNIKVDIKTFI